LVVVELYIFVEKACELDQIAVVVSVKKLRVERRDGFVEFRLRSKGKTAA